MEEEQQFDRKYLENIFRELKTTKNSIESGTEVFLRYCNMGYQNECVNEWSNIIKEAKDMGEEKKFISLLYIFNEIVQKYRIESIIEAFKPALESMVEGLINSPLSKARQETLKIFKIHIQKKVMPTDFLQDLISKLNEGKTEQLPENLPRPPNEFLKLVDNEKDYYKYKQLYEEGQNKEESKVKMNKYGQLYLRNFKEIIQSLDKSHMKNVSEYKLVDQKIQKIKQILKAREEDPSLLKKLPQTVTVSRQNSHIQQQELQQPNQMDLERNGNNSNEGW